MKSLVAALVIAFVACTPRPQEDLASQPSTAYKRSANLRYYTIPIDSVEMLQSSNGGALVRASGIIGSNGCHRFAYLDSSRVGNELHLTFWGSVPIQKDLICTMQLPMLSELVAVQDADGLTLVIHGPDGVTYREPFFRR